MTERGTLSCPFLKSSLTLEVNILSRFQHALAAYLETLRIKCILTDLVIHSLPITIFFRTIWNHVVFWIQKMISF